MWVAPSRFTLFIIVLVCYKVSPTFSIPARKSRSCQRIQHCSLSYGKYGSVHKADQYYYMYMCEIVVHGKMSTNNPSPCLDFISVRGEGELGLVGLREEAALGNGPNAHAAVVARHCKSPRVERVEAEVHHVAPVNQDRRHLSDN